VVRALSGPVRRISTRCCRRKLREILPKLALPADARATIEAIDGCETDLAALCLSGGGIRSATFALGVLQGLARFGLLGQFHYLSTVSGGGYIGSWLSAWRAIEADERIFEALNSSQRTAVEPPQIRGLRADSNYITPTLGLLSADTWTLVTVYIRNLILNWLLFAPFFLGLSGVVLAYLAGDILYVGVSSLSQRGDMDRE
jgi:predicted acylesterase/phospholipase RssA